MVETFDWEYYREQLEPVVEELGHKNQVQLSWECTSRISHFFDEFEDSSNLTSAALGAIKQWLDGKEVLVSTLEEIEQLMGVAESRASSAYEESDHRRSVATASNAGLVAARARFAAAAISHAIANIYRTEFYGEEIETSIWCVDAVALSWAATLGDIKEKEWQWERLGQLIECQDQGYV